jgi:hypothetical protein
MTPDGTTNEEKSGRSTEPAEVLGKVALVLGLGFASLTFALFVTWVAWEVFISGRVFQCGDIGLDVAFWMSADTHEAAGDVIMPGWTWERLKTVNSIFKLAFFALWIAVTMASLRIWRIRAQRK